MIKQQLPEVAQIATIQTKIYDIRGKHVMLDKDIAILYGVETY